MISSENSKKNRNWKTVKKLKIQKKLESELEEIVGKQISLSNGKKNNGYPTERRSIRKSMKK